LLILSHIDSYIHIHTSPHSPLPSADVHAEPYSDNLEVFLGRLGYRGLAQHGGQTGWGAESDPAGVILYVIDRPYRLPFSVPYRLPCKELPSCKLMKFQLLLYSKCTQLSALSLKGGGGREAVFILLVFIDQIYIHI
jgi:hypothetical protein